MPYRYVALVHGGPDDPQRERHETAVNALLAMDMGCLFSTNRLCVFAAKGTPIVALPGRGLLIGHAFPRGDTPCPINRDGPIDRHLLENFWGEYVAIDAMDGGDGRISILRDPSGGVPCAHSIQAGRGFVTSDVSIPISLGLCGRRIDWDFVAHALTFTHLRTARTGLTGISELLPGCVLDIGESGTHVRTAWSPWKFVAADQRLHDPAEVVFGIKHAVTTAVRRWAEADCALLLELSGGLDSSIVAACLRDANARVACCTLVTPSAGTDERPYATLMSDLLGVELNALHINPQAARFDFPLPEDSIVPGMGVSHHLADTSLCEAAEALSTNSFISGAGGDTVFCYLGNASPAADALRERGLSACFSAIQNLSALYGCSLSKAGRLALRKMIRGPKQIRPANTTLLARSIDMPEPMRHPWLEIPCEAFAGDQERIGALVGTQSYVDGMARNRRWPVRFPLLSQPVVEACLRVPTWMWISGGRNRSVARDAFADVLPAYVLNRRSKGTYVTFAGSLYAKNRKRMLRFLEDGQLNSRNLLDLPALRTLLESDVPPKDASFFRIFDLCMIENWIRNQGTADTDDTVAVPVPSRPAACFIDRQTL